MSYVKEHFVIDFLSWDPGFACVWFVIFRETNYSNVSFSEREVCYWSIFFVKLKLGPFYKYPVTNIL